MNEKALTPIEQKTIIFYDDEITAVLVEESGRQVVYVPLRPVCNYLGLAWNAQFERINRDLVPFGCGANCSCYTNRRKSAGNQGVVLFALIVS